MDKLEDKSEVLEQLFPKAAWEIFGHAFSSCLRKKASKEAIGVMRAEHDKVWIEHLKLIYKHLDRNVKAQSRICLVHAHAIDYLSTIAAETTNINCKTKKKAILFCLLHGTNENEALKICRKNEEALLQEYLHAHVATVQLYEKSANVRAYVQLIDQISSHIDLRIANQKSADELTELSALSQDQDMISEQSQRYLEEAKNAKY